MSGAHTHTLYRHGHTVVHRLPPHLKLLAALICTFAIVATPREQLWAFAAYFVLLGLTATVAHLPPGHLLRGLTLEVPFVAFALLLPFVSQGPRTDIAGMNLSEPGMWDCWNILAKATLGLGCSLVLASTTSMYELLLAVQRLHAPALFVQILTFMVRYVDVTGGELDRMRIARRSRGFEARRPRHWRVLAHSVGALFIRAYERGERVHLAMLSRGYTGYLPVSDSRPTTFGDRVRSSVVPAAVLTVTVTAWASPL